MAKRKNEDLQNILEKPKRGQKQGGCGRLLLVCLMGICGTFVFLLALPSPTNTVTSPTSQIPESTSTAEQTLVNVPSGEDSVAVTHTPSVADSVQYQIIRTMEPTTYYAISNANLRTCPETRCAIDGRVLAGDSVDVIGIVKGEVVDASNENWYFFDRNRTRVYIYSGLVTENLPLPTSVNSSQESSEGAASCNGATTCGEMTSCAQARACLAAGFTRIDNDGDGIPCESLCG